MQTTSLGLAPRTRREVSADERKYPRYLTAWLPCHVGTGSHCGEPIKAEAAKPPPQHVGEAFYPRRHSNPFRW